MNRYGKQRLAALTAVLLCGAADADDSGFYVDFNLRNEQVTQDNAVEDANALTLRTRLGYRSPTWRGLSGVIEFEDSRIIAGQDEYTVGPTGFNPGEYSVIADPESTELDQGYLQFSDGDFVAKLGRQVINRDNQRFVGAVGWRQDRQTFDAFAIGWSGIDGLQLDAAYVTKRNRIFADEADVDSGDTLLNAHYKTAYGTIAAYAYLLENDDANDDIDTVGASFRGSTKRDFGSISYAIEYATQEYSAGSTSNDADYLLAEGALEISGYTLTLGQERLGSDGGVYGFSTPLATLHKFNGWADQFLSTPAQGLVDSYVSLGGSFRTTKWTVAWHDFEADDATPGIDDLGQELDVAATHTFAEKYTVGLKYAAYSAGDDAAGYVDTDKFWAWFTVGFQ